MEKYETVTYELLDDGKIARIMLNRPEKRNTQTRQMILDLHAAFLEAESDCDVRVVILGGMGPVFSAGHDMNSSIESWVAPGDTYLASEQRFRGEWELFFQDTLRWRNLRKITIAQVQGPVYAAGLMFMWACDLIVCADNVTFADVVGTRLGMCGVEYFAHPWEFGPRKTKELMLTGDSITVEEAYAMGMVSKIFPVDSLTDDTLAFSRRIAALPSMTSLMIKESVNQTVDNMGFSNSLAACFTIHQLNHAHWAEINPDGRPAAGVLQGIPHWKEAPAIVPALKDRVRADPPPRR
jgi:enoyl-CoA hydratase